MSIETQVAPIETIPINLRYLRAKRVLDIVFTLLLLLPLCLAMAAVAFCIRLDSEGPIFFRQKRIGQNGVPFEMLKFRSMYSNSNDCSHRQSIERYMRGEKLNSDVISELPYKQMKDPRVTQVGRFIRRASIDELPQFFNVLCGDMSIVGPRPPLPYEAEHYSLYAWLRLSGKPGITGTWQVYGRSKVPFQKMVEMDITYLKQQSLKEDLKLIFLTIPVIFLGRGGA